MASEKSSSNTRMVVWIIVLLFIICIGAYFTGYRFDAKNLKAISPGSVILALPLNDVNILINDTDAGIGRVVDGKIDLKYIPAGMQKIGVIKEGYWPWQKVVNVRSGETVTLNPILVNKNPTGEVIPPADIEYAKLKSKILSEVNTNQVTSSDNSVLLTKASTTLKAKYIGENLNNAPFPFCTFDIYGDTLEDSCFEEIVAFTSIEKIRNINFYKNRSDVALLAISNGIYAIELGADDFQNFQPLYKGKNPNFTIGEDGKLYILDEEALMLLNW